MKIDLHLHSEHSWDSNVPIIDYVKKAEELNYGAIAITDHNSTKSHNEIKKLQKETSVLLIPGQEVSTKDGHLLAYGWIEKIPRDLSMNKTVNLIKSKGGICIAAHPYDIFRGGSFSKIFEAEIDGFEVLNASAWFGLPNYLARRAHKKHNNLYGVANSDSHDISEFGSAWSEVQPFESITELGNALLTCKTNGKRIGAFKKMKRLVKRKFNS